MVVNCVGFQECKVTVIVDGEIVFPVGLKESYIIFIDHGLNSKRRNIAQMWHVRIKALNGVISIRVSGILLQDKNDWLRGVVHDLFAADYCGLDWVVN